MDSIFGIGAPELLVILLLAGILMGPQRIRQVAFWLGKVTAQMQMIARGFSRQLSAELEAADRGSDLRDTLQEVQDLRRQLADLKREVSAGITQPMNEGRKAYEESRTAVENSIRPPHIEDRPRTVSPMPVTTPVTAVNGAPPSLPQPLNVEDDPE